MITKLSTTIAITSLLIFSSCYAQTTPDSIYGEWVSTSRSKGGLGATKTYQPDGTSTTTFGALVNFTYKLNKTTLFIYDVNGELQTTEQVIYDGSDIVLKNLNTHKEQKLIRINKTESSTIIGKWKGTHYTGKEKTLHFTSKNNCYLSIPFATVVGKYKLNNKKMTEFIKGKKHSEWK